NKQSSRLGLRAIRLSRELRQICSMPHDDLSAHHWSAWRMLSIARARSINAELCYARSQHKYHASLRLMESVDSLESTGLPGGGGGGGACQNLFPGIKAPHRRNYLLLSISPPRLHCARWL
ncbi:hypothetical protein K6U39_20940, partial [Vibrio parahaemolyticus]|nr:hypothetical protein [Vibrio parahaemolyticus]